MLPQYKDIIELLKKGSTIEAQEQILSLREAAIELQVENQELKQIIKKLEQSLEKKATVKWEKPSYWTYNGDEKDGPFCQRCYDTNEKLIRLQGGKNDSWHCRECDASYYGVNYVKPNRRTIYRAV